MEPSEKEKMLDALASLTAGQRQLIESAIAGFSARRVFKRAEDSDLISQSVLENLGDRLLNHHAVSRQALTKDRFEYALEAALNASEVPAQLVKSRTNRGHDITINGVPVSLKTEASAGIQEDVIHVSKWMELGKGPWELPLLRDSFLEHMKSYDRIFTLRCLSTASKLTRYELVEIPKNLLQEAACCEFEVKNDSTQNPKPGYGYVRNNRGDLKYALYFDGGAERKLQIRKMQKTTCKVHATWMFGSECP